MSNINQMRAELSAIKAKRVVRSTSNKEVSEENTTWLEGTALVIGAAPVHVMSFADAVGVGYKHANAKRKGLI